MHECNDECRNHQSINNETEEGNFNNENNTVYKYSQ